MTNFNIGSQTAGAIQNVGGDMTVHGDVRGAETMNLVELRGELDAIEEGLGRLSLEPERREAARAALGDAKAAAAGPAPDRKRIAHSLASLTEAVAGAEALSESGGKLIRSLGRTAALLGPAGHLLLGALAAL